jgi:hypothetical protein
MPELAAHIDSVPADGEAPPARAEVGSRARAGESHLRLAPTIKERVRPPEPPAPWENDEWIHFLGSLPPAA